MSITISGFITKFRATHFDCEGCTDARTHAAVLSLYFGMTGLHATHMVVGAGILLVPDRAGMEGQVHAGMAYARRVVRALLALRRYCLDFPVPAVYLIDRSASCNSRRDVESMMARLHTGKQHE